MSYLAAAQLVKVYKWPYLTAVFSLVASVVEEPPSLMPSMEVPSNVLPLMVIVLSGSTVLKPDAAFASAKSLFNWKPVMGVTALDPTSPTLRMSFTCQIKEGICLVFLSV